MHPLDAIDLYCERLGPGLWAEPVNALSNAGFIAAGWLAWRRLGPQAPGELRLLAALMALIGVGSFIFHTTARVATAYLDSGFIALYLVSFVCVWLARVQGVPWPRALWGAPGFVAFAALTSAAVLGLHIPALNSDVAMYVSAWLALLLMALTSLPRSRRVAIGLALTLACFTLSLTLRQIDLPLCGRWPLGTHFLWHLLNALALWCSLKALTHQPKRRAAPPR
ncbi:MAG: ceramidase domain-containing protein [Burkholderiales bacterium]|nr:ceramidase domain-containing protein [Burkholderiales bacterium]